MKKIIPFILSLIVVMSFGTTTFAAENNNKISGQLNDYQEVLDKLNNEYGTNVHFASADEYEALGFESKAINVSPEEFESIIRKDIETNLKENNEAHIQAEKIASLKVNEAGSGICAKPNLNGSIKTSTSVTREKDVPGATVHLTATVNDTLGY